MEDRDLLQGSGLGDERVTAKGVIEFTMRGEGEGEDEARGRGEVVRKEEKGIYTNTTYIGNRILERLEGGLKKVAGVDGKGEALR
jgi:hypothetical protein